MSSSYTPRPSARELGYAEATANQTGIGTTITDLTGLSYTVTCDGVTPIKVIGEVDFKRNTAAGYVTVYIREGSTLLQARDFYVGAANQYGNTHIERRLIPTAGSHTYKLSANVEAGGTADFLAAASNPNFIQVIEMVSA